MSKPGHDIDPTHEAQINALLDGELDDADRAALERAAENDPALADAVAAALELHKLLGSMPRTAAPRRLRRRLLAVGGRRFSDVWLSGGALLAALAVAVVVMFPRQPAHPSEAELAQAQRELALALGYIERTSARTREIIDQELDVGLFRPITENTATALSLPLSKREEYEL